QRGKVPVAALARQRSRTRAQDAARAQARTRPGPSIERQADLTAGPPAAAALREPAPAKLNLYLQVIGRRPDGYHLLDSLVAFTELGDEVSAAAASDLSLSVDGPFAESLPRGEDNLVLRAARALGEAFGVPATASLRLSKRLPVASGIGGGSSDAAA